MSESIFLLSLWVLGVCLIGFVVCPKVTSRQSGSRRVLRCLAVLAGVGIPVLGLVTMQHGPWVGLLSLVGGFALLVMSMARTAPQPDTSPS
ncbi:DUF2484 family protein [Pseudooceanicola sp. HF7]|uniref:DUF2484 family protein n=1 Tax=Pseudooceanicola sp. HF7 TaxID=2721560 RepID=UPI001431B36B|nr:DUF2484 family protein [Pseudooceanicola sp. HF7]NIZ11229.1 DUF2484 family protein [Pseudooceanicola sp. HF7]